MLGAGAGLFVLGAVAILTLSIDVRIRLAATGAWSVLLARETWQFVAGFAICRGMRVSADGAISILAGDGREIPARLVPGTVVLQQLAWLRIRTDSGLAYAEPLAGKSTENEAWRRLQVIWRHLGAFG